MLPVRVPRIESQVRVAAALAAFDELIEINERRIERLEDLARSLYGGLDAHGTPEVGWRPVVVSHAVHLFFIDADNYCQTITAAHPSRAIMTG
jgi:hypothetical protein